MVDLVRIDLGIFVRWLIWCRLMIQFLGIFVLINFFFFFIVLLCGITPPKGGGGSVGRILTEIASKIFTTPKDARIPKTYEQKDQEPNRIILTDRQRQIQSHMEPSYY